MHATDRNNVKSILQDMLEFILAECPNRYAVQSFESYLANSYAEILAEILQDRKPSTIGFTANLQTQSKGE